MSIPIVSIILPTHNRSELLQNAIETVRSQTFQDWELIIINDRCKDDTRAIVLKNQQYDHRIHYLVGQKSGVSASRNLGIEHAQGKYIAFLDDDDLWHSEKLARQVDMLIKHPEWALVYTQTKFRYAQEHLNKTHSSLATTFEKLISRNTIALPSVMVRVKAIKTLTEKAFNESFNVAEDIDLWLRISSKLSIGVIQDPLTYCYQSVDRNMQRLWQAYKNYLITFKHLLTETTDPKRQALIKRSICQTHYRIAMLARKEQRYYEAAQAFFSSVFTNPTAGLMWYKQGHGTRLMAFLKPYLGIPICFGLHLLSLLQHH